MDTTTTYDRDALEKKLHDPNATPIYLPMQFLKDITCNFSREHELGRGGYGVVYMGVLQSGKVIAVKKIFDIHLVEDAQFQREVSYLMGIKHQNIVQLVGYCAESRWIAIELPEGNHGMAELPIRLLCFEYLSKESLDKYVSDESSGLDWCKRFEIIKGICSGLHFLHEKYIVHLDLKPQNILMDAYMMPKIADFGLSRLLGAEKSRTIINGNLVGSRGYMAPEYSIQGIISPKADIFSFGVIIIEIITGCRNYPLINTEPYFQPQYNWHQSIEVYLQEYIDNVLGRWSKIFQKEPKHTLSDIYTQQVKECISIALKCVDCDSMRRPNACDIFQMLSAVESTKCYAKDIKGSLVCQVQEEILGKHRMWKLAFQTPLQLPVFTGSKIIGASGSPLEIILMDSGTSSPAALPPQVLHLELVPLMGAFSLEGREDLSNKEFEENIVKERDARCPLLMGDISLTMRDGRATVGKLKFTDNSSWVGCHTFCIGVRVMPGSLDGGVRVQEAITEAFVVTDHHWELCRKRDHPSSLSDDEVWRVEKMGKGVASSSRNLEQQHVETVHEFVRMLRDKPDELCAILRDCMTGPMWKAVMAAEDSKHALVYEAGLIRSAHCIWSLLKILPAGECTAWKPRDEFLKFVVKPREGKMPLLIGDVGLTMRDGCATVGQLQFTDNSSWLRSRKFRIGVRVVPGSFNGGGRVLEAVTEAFIVRDYRGELYRKHYPPALDDEVWRLEKIGKEGAFNRKLRQNNVVTVQEFVRMLMVKPDELRGILGDGMSDLMWAVLTNHARACDPGDRVYAYSTTHGTIHVNSLFQVLKVELGGVECPLEQLSRTQKDDVRNLILEAYDNRDSLQEVDASKIHASAAGSPGYIS